MSETFQPQREILASGNIGFIFVVCAIIPADNKNIVLTKLIAEIWEQRQSEKKIQLLNKVAD